MRSYYGNSPRFIPDQLNRAALRAGRLIAGALARRRYQTEINISNDDLARLSLVGDQRSIWMPNHPQPTDWLILFLLSSRLSHPFHFMTAHEQFFGSRRYWLPKFGAYSIRRGGWGDIDSVAESLRLLARQRCSLVMFPEGRCTFSSRSVFDFKAGAVKIGFNHLASYGGLQNRNLFLVPMAIRYQHIEPIEERLAERLDLLQQVLSTTSSGQLSHRIRSLTFYTVALLENEYDLRLTDGDASWRHRITRLCLRILSSSEQALGIDKAPRNGLMNRACNIRQVLARNGHQHGIVDKSTYEQAYFPTLLVLILESIGELDISNHLSVSQQADLVASLERIVYRIPDPLPFGHRRAVIRIGNIIDLLDWVEDYRLDRQGTSKTLTDRLREDVANNLSLLLRA